MSVFRHTAVLLLAVALLAAASNACAGIVLYAPTGWTNAPSIEGWDTQDSVFSLSNPGSGGIDGGADGYLRILVNASLSPLEDTVFSAGAADTGNYQLHPSLGVRFWFYAQDVLPAAAALYLYSAVSGNTWEYAFNNTQVGDWQQHSIGFDFDFGNGWAGGGGGDATDFWNDLANVGWIGINIVTAPGADQVFGIDNWEYYIPEPGSIAFIIAAALPLILRRKILATA